MTGPPARIVLLLAVATLAAAAAAAASLLLLAFSDTSDERVGKLSPRAVAGAVIAPTLPSTVPPAETTSHGGDDDNRGEHDEDADD